MATVAQPRQESHTPPHRNPAPPALPALTAAMDRVGSAQHRALLAWHQRLAMVSLDAEIERAPAFPLILCNDSARAFAPARGAPAPAGVA